MTRTGLAVLAFFVLLAVPAAVAVALFGDNIRGASLAASLVMVGLITDVWGQWPKLERFALSL
jgi:hypothetical protein